MATATATRTQVEVVAEAVQRQRKGRRFTPTEIWAEVEEEFLQLSMAKDPRTAFRRILNGTLVSRGFIQNAGSGSWVRVGSWKDCR